MALPNQLTSMARRLIRKSWIFRRLYAQIDLLQNREGQALQDLANIKGELAASREQAINELAVLNNELAVLKNELTAATEQATMTQGELRASNERADTLARSLAEMTRLEEHIATLSTHIYEHLPTLGNLLLGRFAEAQAEFLGQIPLITANLVSLQGNQEEMFRSLRNRLNQSAAGAGMANADRYLDLLEGSLTGTLRLDVSQAPWAKNVYDPARRAVGQDWPSQAETMIGTARMRNLRMLTQRALEQKVPGDLIETGVWRGGACIYMRGILAAAGDTHRRVFVADSFRGLPAPDEAAYPDDAGDLHHTVEQLAISRHEVECNFRRYGLLDEQVIFLEGWFKDTLPTVPTESLAVLRLDGDMYESTMDALNALYAKVSPGGFVIIDDYVLKACAKAVDDFRDRHDISAPMHEVDGAAVWWQVPENSSALSASQLNGKA